MDKRTLCELLECSVCMEPLNECNNKVLPCQHTFCRFCLDAIVAVESRLVCPECRLSVDTKVDDLPSNVLLNRILSTLKNPSVSTSSSFSRKCDRERRAKKGLSSLLDYRSSDMAIPCARALYNYNALEIGDLSFKKDDVIELLHQVDENWFVGRFNGKQGFLPSNYIQIICPLPSLVPTCRAKCNFDHGNENWKKECLTFKKGDRLSLIRQVSNNWLEGSFNHRIGIFPASFVELNDASRLLLLQNKSPFDLFSLQIQHPEENDSITPPTMVQSVNESMSSSDLIGSNSSRPSSQSKSHPNLLNVSKRSLIGSSDLQISSAKQSNQNLEDSDVPNFERDGTLPLYQASFSYKPQSSNELELEAGKMYVALKQNEGGWLLGKSVARGTVGLMPGNFVKFLKNWNYIEKGSPNVLQNCKGNKSKRSNSNRIVNESLKSQPSKLTSNQSSSYDDLMALGDLKEERTVELTEAGNVQDNPKRRSANVEFLFYNKLCNNVSPFDDSSGSVSIQPPSSSSSLSSFSNHRPSEQTRGSESVRLPTACNHCMSKSMSNPPDYDYYDSQLVNSTSNNNLLKSSDSLSVQLCHYHLQRRIQLGVAPLRNHHSPIAYGISSLIHRSMVKQKSGQQRCQSANPSRSQQ